MAVSALRRRRRRRLLLISAVLLVAVIWGGLYLATTSFFLRLAVLPFLSEILRMDLHATDVELSVRHSRLKVSDLVVGDRSRPVAVIRRGELSTSLWKVLCGDYDFSNLALDGVTLALRRDAAGSWNFGGSPGAEEPAAPVTGVAAAPSPEKPVHEGSRVRLPLTLRRARISGLTLVLQVQGVDDSRCLTLRNGEFDLEGLGPSGEAKVRFDASAAFANRSGIALEDSILSFEGLARLSPQLIPEKFTAAVTISGCRGRIGGSSFSGRSFELRISGDGDGRGLEIRQLSLNEFSDGGRSGGFEASGRVFFTPFAFAVNCPRIELGESLCDLAAGTFSDLDPGKMALSGAFECESTPEKLKASGNAVLTRRGTARFGGREIQLPDISAAAVFDFSVDDASRRVDMRKMSLNVRDDGSGGFMSINLEESVSYIWRESGVPSDPARFAVKFSNYPLGMVKLASGNPASFPLRDGRLNGELTIKMGRGLRDVGCAGELRADPLIFAFGDGREVALGAESSVRLTSGSRGVLTLDGLSGRLYRKGVQLGEWTVSGSYDCFKHTGSGVCSLAMAPLEMVAVYPDTELEKLARRFPEARGNLKFACAAELKKNRIEVSGLVFSLTGARQKVAELTMPRFDYDFRRGVLNRPLPLALNITGLPLEVFSPWLGDDLHLDGGSLSGKISASLSGLPAPCEFSGGVTVDCAGAGIGNVRLPPFRSDGEFSGASATGGRIVLEKFNIRSRSGKSELLTLSGGRAEFDASGDFRAGCRIDGAGLGFLNDLSGKRLFAEGVINGSLAVSRRKNESRLDASLKLAGVTGREGESLSGSCELALACDAESVRIDRAGLKLISNRRPVGDLDCRGAYSLKGQPRSLTLSSEFMDLDFFERFWSAEPLPPVVRGLPPSPPQSAVRAKAAAVEEPTSAVEGFDFGGRTVVDCRLERIVSNGAASASFQSFIELDGKTLTARSSRLKVEDCVISSDFTARSTPSGINYSTRGRSDGRLLIQTGFPSSLQGLRCELLSLRWSIEGGFARYSGFLDHVDGGVDADFGQVILPNAFGNGRIGRLLLLPLDVMPEIAGLIPNVQSSRFRNFFEVTDSFRKDVRSLEFSNGTVRLRARDGVLHFGDFRFRGDLVQEFAFSGHANLAPPQRVKLKSSTNINGVIVPVEIAGTLSEPTVDVKNTVRSVLKDNTGAFIDAIGGLFRRKEEK